MTNDIFPRQGGESSMNREEKPHEKGKAWKISHTDVKKVRVIRGRRT